MLHNIQVENLLEYQMSLTQDDECTGMLRERSGSVVECLTWGGEAAGSSLTGITTLWSLSKVSKCAKTTPDPGYQWESDKLKVRDHKRESQEVSPFPAGDHNY